MTEKAVMIYQTLLPAALALLCLVFWITYGIKEHKISYAAIPVCSWCLHVIVFSIAVYFEAFSDKLLNAWSTAIRLHALLLLTATTLAAKEN